MKNDFAKYFGECCNLFKYFVSHIIISRINTFLYYRTNYISLCWIVLRNAFLASGWIRIKNIWMINSLVFSNCYFRLCKNWYLQNFCLIKKWMMLEIVDESIFRIITLPNNLVLICKFQGNNFVFCSLHMFHEIRVFY